jgi:hypothetical protein
LSLLIVKSKAHGGFHFDAYTNLYDSLVWSVISYGAAIWGTRGFSITFLCKIFSKSVYSSKMHSLNFVIILKHQFFFLLTAFLIAHRNTL